LKDDEQGGVGGKGEKECIWKDWTDQSKAHAQWSYIETPLWTSIQILIMKTGAVK
jgi:hypothetical protein